VQAPTPTGASSTPHGAPEAFVKALTAAGYLAALIPRPTAAQPRHRRRVDHPRRDPQRRQRWRVPRADLHDGHAAAARLEAETRVLPKIASGELRLQASASPSRPPARTRRSEDDRHPPRRHLRRARPESSISRAEHSDLLLLVVRTTPIEGDQAHRRAVDPAIDLRDAVGRADDPPIRR
jgi:acyl-CoA dehydrogenase